MLAIVSEKLDHQCVFAHALRAAKPIDGRKFLALTIVDISSRESLR